MYHISYWLHVYELDWSQEAERMAVVLQLDKAAAKQETVGEAWNHWIFTRCFLAVFVAPEPRNPKHYLFLSLAKWFFVPKPYALR